MGREQHSQAYLPGPVSLLRVKREINGFSEVQAALSRHSGVKTKDSLKGDSNGNFQVKKGL